MGTSQLKGVIWFGLLIAVLGVQGCSISWIGRQIKKESLNSFLVGKTTPSDVEKALGMPENVMIKPQEQITVYVYQSIVNTSLGLPFPITLGRSKQKGIVLNVIFKDGLLMGLSSNSKCNTAGPDGLSCCHVQEMLYAHEYRRT